MDADDGVSGVQPTLTSRLGSTRSPISRAKNCRGFCCVRGVGAEETLRMRVLYLSPRICWPLRSGAHLRDFHLARQIARRVSLSYVGLDTEGLAPGEDMRHERLPELPDVEVVRVRREAGYSWLNLLRGFVGPTPVSILNFTTPVLMSALERLFR